MNNIDGIWITYFAFVLVIIANIVEIMKLIKDAIEMDMLDEEIKKMEKTAEKGGRWSY